MPSLHFGNVAGVQASKFIVLPQGFDRIWAKPRSAHMLLDQKSKISSRNPPRFFFL